VIRDDLQILVHLLIDHCLVLDVARTKEKRTKR